MNWYYQVDDRIIGPLTESELYQQYTSGIITNETPVGQEGDTSLQNIGVLFPHWTNPDARPSQESSDTQATAFKFQCPACGQNIATDSSHSGHHAHCPTCEAALIVPGQNPPANGQGPPRRTTPEAPGNSGPPIITASDNRISNNRMEKERAATPPPLPKKPTKKSSRKKVVFLILGILAFSGVAIVFESQTGPASEKDSSSQRIEALSREFGITIDSEAAIVYAMGYAIGEDVTRPPRPGEFERIVNQSFYGNPETGPAFRKLALAGLYDGYQGKPNRLEGLNLQN